MIIKKSLFQNIYGSPKFLRWGVFTYWAQEAGLQPIPATCVPQVKRPRAEGVLVAYAINSRACLGLGLGVSERSRRI